jgi:predicted flap endonuclease-1-like 5' DNA nuclease
MVIAAAVSAGVALLALIWGLVGWIRSRRLRRDLASTGAESAARAEEITVLRRRLATLRAGEQEAAWAVAAAAERRVALTARLERARTSVADAEQRTVGLEARIDALTDAVSAASSAPKTVTTEQSDRRLEDRLIAREAALTDLRERLDGLTKARDAEVRRLQARIGELERLHIEVDRRDQEIEHLEEAVKEAEEARRRAEDELQRLDRATPAAAGSGSETEVRALKSALRSERERNARLVRRTSLGGPDRPSGDPEEVRRLQARIAELERVASPEPDPVDDGDVKAIKGIGPKIADILAGLGITSLRQIARLTEADLDRIGEHLPVYGGRAKDDRWVEQARELLGMDAAG